MQRFIIALLAFLSVSCLPHSSLKALAPVLEPNCGCCDTPCDPCCCVPCDPCAPCCPCELCPCPFSGFYVGANGGWAVHERGFVDRTSWVSSSILVDANPQLKHNTVMGGVQVGFNWMCCGALVGAEGDLNWACLNRRDVFVDSPAMLERFVLEEKFNWFGTLRVRGGIVCNNLLLYVTAGGAGARIRKRWFVDSAEINEGFQDRCDRFGAAIGTGVEWAQCVFSLKFEALYLIFPDRTRTFFSVFHAGDVRFTLSDSLWIIRAGINLNFGNLGLCCWY